MKVILFGASGMVGGGALTECLEDPGVSSVVSVGRSATGRTHPKLQELVVRDLSSLGEHRDEIGPVDACLYCLGVSSAGMSEEAYRRITLDLTVVAADVLQALNPEAAFCFVSGQGSGNQRIMWARVKGEAEQDILARPFKGYVFRPGFIQPVKWARSKTTLYRALYAVLAPLGPILRAFVPNAVTTTEIVGRAMLRVAREGYPKRILETSDINDAASKEGTNP